MFIFWENDDFNVGIKLLSFILLAILLELIGAYGGIMRLFKISETAFLNHLSILIIYVIAPKTLFYSYLFI